MHNFSFRSTPVARVSVQLCFKWSTICCIHVCMSHANSRRPRGGTRLSSASAWQSSGQCTAFQDTCSTTASFFKQITSPWNSFFKESRWIPVSLDGHFLFSNLILKSSILLVLKTFSQTTSVVNTRTKIPFFVWLLTVFFFKWGDDTLCNLQTAYVTCGRTLLVQRSLNVRAQFYCSVLL